MDLGTRIRRVLPAVAVFCALCCPAGEAQAVPFLEFVDPNPAAGNQFGATVVALSTGNVVITSPFDDAGGTDAGAVYLFDGATGALISTLRGSAANHNVGGGGVTALSNGNFVVRSPNWDNGALANVGAVTWGSGTTGVAGVVSAANSLVGSTNVESVGSSVTALTNGNYVVISGWANGGNLNAGAVTWGSGTTGVTGTISAANSLVGAAANDFVGTGVTALPNGHYVVRSQLWNNGPAAATSAGAVTWCNGATGATGTVSEANSLVGTTTNDNIGNAGVTVLPSGNYVVSSTNWDNLGAIDAGAHTWCSGTVAATGPVSGANSLVGSTASDNAASAVFVLSNGNYVVRIQNWDNGAVVNAGAVTWGSGTAGVSGVVSAANSLVGSTANDGVGGGVTALSNGNYVVASLAWDNGAVTNAGAATWGNGASGVTGVVSAANSLVGTTAGDVVSNSGVTALSNGNYVVASGSWDNGAIVDVGAATWASGTTGLTGAVSAANSLVGSATINNVGGGGSTALSNGNYVVKSPSWDNGAVSNVGAVTWANGSTGLTGTVSTMNSLIGSTAGDNVGVVTALSNGNYVVTSTGWDGVASNVGAATWGNGTSGTTGVVSAANSLVGSAANDNVGSQVTVLTNGNYVVVSSSWDHGAAAGAGAATWGSGTSGVAGVVSATNSLVGSTSSDGVGVVTALSNGNYVVATTSWDNGALSNAGSMTWGSGTSGVNGAISSANSVVGAAANTTLQPIVVDDVNVTFFARFLAEGGGRVRVGPVDAPPAIVSAVDIPDDQGGWIRLTFDRSSLDLSSVAPQVTMYGVWRKVPGTLPTDAGRRVVGTVIASAPDAASAKRLRATSGLDVWEAEGGTYVTSLGAPPAGIESAFPAGTWALIANVPALQQAQYVADVPTISNAAPNDFVVTAHTTVPSLWFVSAPASGQSVDNLAPAQPASLAGSYSGGQTDLSWAPNSENDLDSYRVYRGVSAGFTPGPGNQIAAPSSPEHSDVGPAGGYYKVSAVDVNGNESTYALLTPSGTTGVGEGAVAFALDGARPNPANRTGINVTFALPATGAARLDLLDVSGRVVWTRDVGSLGVGRHTVNLADPRAVAPGVYWVRLTQGPNQRNARVTVLD